MLHHFMDPKRKLLITGGAGKIGRQFIEQVYGSYNIRVFDRAKPYAPRCNDKKVDYITGDLSIYSDCLTACRGIDTILHLAADSSINSGFHNSLLKNNIIATYNLYEAAVEEGCKRVVFASSIHAVSGYPKDVQVTTSMNPKPLNLYGVSKCFGEAVAFCFFRSYGISSIVVRIGAYNTPSDYESWFPRDEFDSFIAPEDLHQLFINAIETPNIDFAIFHGISDNKYKRLDLSDTKELLNYDPIYDGFNLI